MQIIYRIKQLRTKLHLLQKKKGTFGFIPTMGALHQGHLKLISRARKENDIVIVSIFVNPQQFSPQEDYLKYPRPFREDKMVCQQAGVDILFCPTVQEMYPVSFKTFVTVEELSDLYCGKFRPGHFRGVTTVVLKLLNIVFPDRAYFGSKDFQQIRIIQQMVTDLNLPVQIVPVDTIRDKNGLAISSRNQYLTPGQRHAAGKIYLALIQARQMVRQGERRVAKIISTVERVIKSSSSTKIDYIAIANANTLEQFSTVLQFPAVVLIAVWYGKTRLIDNLLLVEN